VNRGAKSYEPTALILAGGISFLTTVLADATIGDSHWQ